MKTRFTRFIQPYKELTNGKLVTNLPLSSTAQLSGVYFIKSNRSDKIIYVGYSVGKLYSTIYRHFQKWTDIQRAVKTRFTYAKMGYKVRIIFTTPQRAALLEKYLIMKLQPRDNSIKYEQYLTKKQELNAQSILDESVIISKVEVPF